MRRALTADKVSRRARTASGVEEQLADLLAVDLDHGDPLEQPPVELVVALDVHLAELEAGPSPAQLEQPLARLVAEMAARPAVER